MASRTSPEGEALHPPSWYRRTVIGPAQLAELRAQLRYLARLWALPEDCTDRLLMIVNELVSNAIDHARTGCDITVRRTRSVVRVLVADDSPLPPRIPPHDVNAARGRGLQMVRALAGRWGWTARHPGKTMWAVVDCSHA
jgi:two-component sensor histidine kinase